MVTQKSVVFVNCVHHGCSCQRMFLLRDGEELPHYACIKHRRLHRVEPVFDGIVIKTGYLLKKGDRSPNYSKRCVVLLSDRMIIYEKVGDPIPICCINLNGCVVEQDEQIKRRFCVYSTREKRPFCFEAILDYDFIDWFMGIQNNIELLGENGDTFRSWDEDDYSTPGIPITSDTRRPHEFKEYHQNAMYTLQQQVGDRLFNGKHSKDQTLSLNMWTGTWNMGECDPPFNLEEWISNRFDIIAIGVEECMKLPDLEMRANGVIGNDYTYYVEKVGSVRKEVGFHGYIAVIVFVKMDLIQCGLIPAHDIVTKNIALGKNLVVTRASNKGGVRVRLPLDLSVINHNFSLQTSLDFICCHLAADTNGESKVEKRNKNAHELLNALVYDTTEPRGFVFVMGDLNYRIDMDAQNCIELIVNGIGLKDEEAISQLLDNDQLTTSLVTSATFPGFQELSLPSFAPTYKKKKGDLGDPKGYTNFNTVKGCYDWILKDKTQRTPSYTDRILYRCYLTSYPSMLYVYSYDAINTIRDSDHTPLYGAVCLRIGPNCNAGPTTNHIIPSISRIETLEGIDSSLFFRMMIDRRGNLQPITSEFLNEILPFFSPAYIHANMVMMKPGDYSNCSLLFILKGHVRLMTEHYELKVLEPGDWFGGESLIEGRCGYTAITDKETVCLSLSSASLGDLMTHGYRDYVLSIKRMVLGQSVNGLLILLNDLIDNYNEEAINLLRYQLVTVCKKKGKVLSSQGDDTAAAFFLIAGQLIVTMKNSDGEEIVIAQLGPGTVIGTEMLQEGVVSNYTIKTGADCLLWILTRDDYLEYVRMDPEQVQSGKAYNQMMYYWVNTNQLPITPSQDAVIDIIGKLFGTKVYDREMLLWDPMTPAKGYRVLLSGKAIVGGEVPKPISKSAELNEFDLDVGALVSTDKQKVVSSGCILNQFNEEVRAADECVVIDVDKKQLKVLCMLLRWKFFGYGITRHPIIKKEIDYQQYMGLQVCVNDLDGMKGKGHIHVTITAVDKYNQTIEEESHQTKDLRSTPFCWNENFRLGDGRMGLNVIAGLRVEVVQSSSIVCEGVVGLDVIFDKFVDGRACHSVSMKLPDGKVCSLFLSFKGLGSDIMSYSPTDVPLENIAMSRHQAAFPSLTPVKEEDLLSFPKPIKSLPPKPLPKAPSKPLPSKPLPSKPLPTEPVPSKPLPTEPVPSKPLPTEPVPSKPLPSKPLPPKPPKANTPHPSKPAPPPKPTRSSKPLPEIPH